VTGALVIMVVAESVAVWWVRQESLLGVKFKREKTILHFRTELRIMFKRLVNVDFIFFHSHRNHIPCFRKLYLIRKSFFPNNYSQWHILFINI